MESQPQNPEFRNNPENFHQCKCNISFPNRIMFAQELANKCFLFYLFDLILNVPSTSHQQSYSYIGRVSLGSTSTKLGLIFLVKDTTQ